MMTSKERMEAAFKCEEVDRVPVFCEQGGINRRALGITYQEMVTDGEKCAVTWPGTISSAMTAWASTSTHAFSPNRTASH